MNEPIQKVTSQIPTPSLLVRFWKDECGQDLIEYALLAALIASGSVASTQNLAIKVANTFTHVQNTLTTSIPSTTPGSASGGGTTSGSGGSRGHGGFDGDNHHSH